MPFPVSTMMAGTCTSMAPDTCNMPVPSPAGPVPTPTPYVNIAMTNQCMPPSCSKKAKGLNMAFVSLMSTITMSSGNEPGCMPGGVASGMIKGPVMFGKGSVKVMIEGQPVVFHTCPTKHNGPSPNTVGTQTVPSQAKIMVGA